MRSDGPNSSPTRAPTRTLYERLDGLQLLDPRNLNSRRSYRVRVGIRVGLELGQCDPTFKVLLHGPSFRKSWTPTLTLLLVVVPPS